jgi:hypothetical protein
LVLLAHWKLLVESFQSLQNVVHPREEPGTHYDQATILALQAAREKICMAAILTGTQDPPYLVKLDSLTYGRSNQALV